MKKIILLALMTSMFVVAQAGLEQKVAKPTEKLLTLSQAIHEHMPEVARISQEEVDELHAAAGTSNKAEVDVYCQQLFALLGTATCNIKNVCHKRAIVYANLDVRDVDGKTTLVWAAYMGNNSDDTKALIAAGADLDARAKFDRTALMWAAYWGNTDDTKALIAGGANLDAQDEFGRTALMKAAYRGNVDDINALIAGGAALDIQDKDGKTALMKAVYSGYIQSVKRLIINGAALDIQDKDGKTALDIAIAEKREKVIKIINVASVK